MLFVILINSLRRVSHWQDPASSHYERRRAASSGYGWRLWKGGYMRSYLVCRTLISLWKVAYVDTEGTFRPDRIRAIAERFGVDGDMALENILYGPYFSNNVSSYMLMIFRLVDGAHQRMFHTLCGGQGFQALGRRRLVLGAAIITSRLQIVDSIMACFRTDYSGRGELSERQQKVCNRLDRISTVR